MPGRTDRRDPLETHRPVLGEIAALEVGLRRLGDGEIRDRGRELGRRARSGERSGDLLPQIFALTREAGRRALGVRLHDEQLCGGIVMHRGEIAEMATGEGKTLAAVAPAALLALAGRGVHVLTFNDYLARRDAGWMGPVYSLLGLEVGCVREGMSSARRREAYAGDVTYVTAREAGFDLLRDGLCLEPGDQVHRGLHAALVDEADSILVDEARLPLVVASETEGPGEGPARIASAVRSLERGRDFDVDGRDGSVSLTGEGAARLESLLGCPSLFSRKGARAHASVLDALRAEHLLRRDVDYILRDGKVELVDEFTGRVADRRHWPDGLQAAVEAKEGLGGGSSGRVIASITLQHFAGLYDHLCGMTATAEEAAAEMEEVYGLRVRVIPSHLPCIRIDHPDSIHAGAEARDAAAVREIRTAARQGRPVLVGTDSVSASESLARRLAREGIPCRLLNARHDEEEAELIAGAGRSGVVTISTNMAGRGTDIRLGGPSGEAREEVAARGGLHVVGLGRRESPRLDRQLRGRAGRQGDPGSSRFFVSLDDPVLRPRELHRLLPSSWRSGSLDRAIDSRILHREVAAAQAAAGSRARDARLHLRRFTEVLERQRRILAGRRQRILTGEEAPLSLDGLDPGAGRRLRERAGAEAHRRVERRLALLALDAAWADHLQHMMERLDSIHLVALGGATPLVEFTREAIEAFRSLDAVAGEHMRAGCARVGISGAEVDWSSPALNPPPATWTYQVDEILLPPNVLMQMAHSTAIGLWGTLILWPVLFLWGLRVHWKRRRKKREMR